MRVGDHKPTSQKVNTSFNFFLRRERKDRTDIVVEHLLLGGCLGVSPKTREQETDDEGGLKRH